MRQKIFVLCFSLLIIMGSMSIHSISLRTNNSVQLTSMNNQIAHNQIEPQNHFQPNSLTQISNKLIDTKSLHSTSKFLAVTSVNTDTSVTGFISTWNTSKISFGYNDSTQITLPLVLNGIYDFNVSWGDGNSNLITNYSQSAITHTYAYPGVYTVNITGTIIGWSFNGSNGAIKLTQISNWGHLRLGNEGYYFSGASNLALTTNAPLNLNGTSNLIGMFENCYALGNSGNLNSWNVSKVTNMAFMFAGAVHFNQSLNSWDVSQVSNMSNMFRNALSFNNPLSSWNVSSVIDTSYMFLDALRFNQSLNSWDVSHDIDMNAMFALAGYFNQSLNSWDVSHVTDMQSIFFGAASFNQPLSSWNVSRVINMTGMFYAAISFNQPLASWKVSSVTDMSYMFFLARQFNQPLGSWNVSRVTNMAYMFANISLSILNYDQLLQGWSRLPNLSHNVNFDAGSSKYSLLALNARETLIYTLGWSIKDGGISPIDATSINSTLLIGLLVIVSIAIVSLSAYLTVVYFKYKKKRNQGHPRFSNFWNSFRNIFKLRRQKSIQNEFLSNETMDKIEQIINENQEK